MNRSETMRPYFLISILAKYLARNESRYYKQNVMNAFNKDSTWTATKGKLC